MESAGGNNRQKRKEVIEQFIKCNTHISIQDDNLSFGVELVYEYMAVAGEILSDMKEKLATWTKVRLVCA